MSAPICPTHGEGFGVPCYMCVDAENRTLRALYAEAVRALVWTRKHHERALEGVAHAAQESMSFADSVLARPEAQAVLKEAPRG